MQVLKSARTPGPSPHKIQSIQNNAAQRTPSPMGNYVNNLHIEDMFQKPLSKQLSNLRAFVQPLTPPVIPSTPESQRKKKQNSQPKQAMTSRKHYENINQTTQYLLSAKTKKTQNSSVVQTGLKSQKNSSSNISLQNQNYQSNQETKRATSFYQILKEKDSNNISTQHLSHHKQLNLNVQSIYGIRPTEQRPETARTKNSDQQVENTRTKKNEQENLLPIAKNLFQKPLQNDDDKDLFYQIIKQRNTEKKITCINHKNRQAPYNMYQEETKVFICADCAIQQAYNGKVIFIDNEQLCYKIPNQNQLEWNIIKPDSLEKSLTNKFDLIQKYITSSQEVFQTASNVKEVLKVSQNQSLTNLSVNEKIIEELLNTLKANLMNRISNQSILVLPKQLVDQAKIQITGIIDELQQIKNDIEMNLSDIIGKMEVKSLTMILDKYYQKLNLYRMSLSELFKIIKCNYSVLDAPSILMDLQNDIVQKYIPEEKIKSTSFDNKIQPTLSKTINEQITIQKPINDSLLECIDEPEKLRTEDSIVLRSNETQQFLLYLKKDSIDTIKPKLFDHSKMMEIIQAKCAELSRNLPQSPNFNEK